MQRVFILGNPRSGTSLLRIMLNSHPHMAAPPESGFLLWWRFKYGLWSAHDAASESQVRNFVKDLLTSKKIETWKLREESMVDFITKRRPLNYMELGSLVYEFWSLQNNKQSKVVIDKNNYYIHHLEDIFGIWPDAKFIFLIRDGRDVACSYLDMQSLETTSPYKPKLPANMEDIALEWQENNQHIYEFLLTLSKEQWRMIRYEDLVNHTKSTLVDITSFLNMEFSEQMLSYYLMNDEPASTLDWKRKTLEKPDESNIGRYKARLKPDEIKIFDSIANAMLTTAGYAT